MYTNCPEVESYLRTVPPVAVTTCSIGSSVPPVQATFFAVNAPIGLPLKVVEVNSVVPANISNLNGTVDPALTVFIVEPMSTG